MPGFPDLPDRGRAAIVAVAQRECALWAGKGPNDPDCHELLKGYWRSAWGRWEPSCDADAWCGIFALSCIHEGILCPKVMWQLGSGFATRWLTVTSDPQPGDVAYLSAPFQHHAIVTDVQGDMITTVSGNQPGILQRTAPRHHWSHFYSIAPLLDGRGA